MFVARRQTNYKHRLECQLKIMNWHPAYGHTMGRPFIKNDILGLRMSCQNAVYIPHRKLLPYKVNQSIRPQATPTNKNTVDEPHTSGVQLDPEFKRPSEKLEACISISKVT